ncbi:MAG: response regulator transcription factor [Planctomycetes bacterium]|nr:response regulator transcription factor [Planctomycetota bacterium]
MAKILVIEDDPSILLGIRKNLEYDGHEVLIARDGEEGLTMAFDARPDLILLDIMLPHVNGFEICRSVRKHEPAVPIIILSAKDQEADKITGLSLGADDYITKPFSVRELVARVKAALRRSRALTGEEAPYLFGDVEVDYAGRVIRVKGEPVECTPKEFDLLRFLIRNKGRVVSRDQILNKVWGYDYEGTPRTIDNFVQKLRIKVERDPVDPSHILTVRGIGYKFEN